MKGDIYIKKRKIGKILPGIILAAFFGILLIVIIKANAGNGDTTYKIGSSAEITYKRNENKVYYSRKHFSSGSDIRYYTHSFVISIMEAEKSDDLSNLNNKRGEVSLIIPVSTDGKGTKESEIDKTLDFYWFDSDTDDDGYITTT